MNNYIVLISISAGIFLILFIILLCIHYRNLIKKKNCDIFHNIKEQTRLKKEMEIITIEKEMLVKILNDKIVIKLEINK